MPYLFTILILLSVIIWIIIPFLKSKIAGRLSFITSALITIFTLIPAFLRLTGSSDVNFVFPVFGIISAPDALSAWFLLVINIIFVAGSFYGMGYLKQYSNKENDLRLHWFLMPVFHLSMIAVCWVSNWFYFLVFWEIMSLSSFILILFEREKEATLKAALNYFVQMHISILFLMTAVYFLWNKTGSLDFSAISAFSSSQGAVNTLWLFLFFFFGFAIKAGFVPFHTWLPHAHPAAPSHISGIMSGVIIKMGIYGIIRVILNIEVNLVMIGWIILLFSIATALYGIMQGIVQQNLKRFLAYSSIENIGIIGLGIGTGTLGFGYSQPILIFLGFGGALLHTLNHGIFKSLLFFSTGNVYQATHTLTMNHLGGLNKKMQHTSSLFIFASIAACAIPPLNGFISEFLIYAGLFQGILIGTFLEKILFLLLIMLLTFIGGMAILGFTKVTGITFLGNPRVKFEHEVNEAGLVNRVPMYFLGALIFSIGLLPLFFLWLLKEPLGLIAAGHTIDTAPFPVMNMGSLLIKISLLGGIFFSLLAFIILLRRRSFLKHGSVASETWGCAYTTPTAKMQYTGESFSRIFRKLFHPVVFVRRQKLQITSIFPKPHKGYESKTHDRIEEHLIRQPLDQLVRMAGKLRIFQNGQIQYYLLYGFLFILLILLMEVIK
jgi:hydrogenase-4 component B